MYCHGGQHSAATTGQPVVVQGAAPITPLEKGFIMRERTRGITIRVTDSEKKRMEKLAKMCGLSLSEYLRKLGSGHQPKEIPSDNFYTVARRLEELAPLQNEEVSRSIHSCLEELYSTYIYGKEEKDHGRHQNMDD